MRISRCIWTLVPSLLGAWLAVAPGSAIAKNPRGKRGAAEKVRAPRSNTQIAIPHEKTRKNAKPRLLDFADVDGDNVEEWLVAQGRRLFVAKVGLQATGKYYAYLSGDAERLFAAHLRGKADADVCVVVKATKTRRRAAGRYVECFALKRARKNRKKVKFRRMFTQDSVVPVGGHVLAGDFNGDGKDELLVYTPKSGNLSAFALKGRSLSPVQGFSMGQAKRAALCA